MLPDIKDITEGIGRQINASQRLDEGVAIRWSQSSMYLAKYLDQGISVREAASAWQAAIQMTGRQVRYVVPEDMRTRQYLGYTDAPRLRVQTGLPALVSMLPYAVEEVEIGISERFSRGKSVDVALKVDVGGQLPADHVFRVELLDPSGRGCGSRLYDSQDAPQSPSLRPLSLRRPLPLGLRGDP